MKPPWYMKIKMINKEKAEVKFNWIWVLYTKMMLIIKHKL